MGLTNPAVGGLWGKVYEEVLGEIKNSVSIDSIDGDIDREYLIIVRGVAALAAATKWQLVINNDTGTNYGLQYLAGAETTVSANRYTTGTAFDLGDTTGVGRVTQFEGILHAESGFVRTLLAELIDETYTTVVTAIKLFGQVWSNTTAVISNLLFKTNQVNGMGIGTYIVVFKRLPG